MKAIFLLVFSLGFLGLTIKKDEIIKVPVNSKDGIQGIDISHHNKVYDWKKISSNSYFCIIKATEGYTFRDPKFKSYWKSTEKHKIVRGAYHFFSPDVSAEKQFKNYSNVVKLKKGDIPPVLDVEVEGINIDEVNKWLRLAEKHYGVKPIIYCGVYYYNTFMKDKIDTSYPIWIADAQIYESESICKTHDCFIWQYSDKGRVEGIYGDVDLDRLLVDGETFHEMLVK